MSIWYQPHECKLKLKQPVLEETGEYTLKIKDKVYRGGPAELDTPLVLTEATLQSCLKRRVSSEVVRSFCKSIQADKNMQWLLEEEHVPVLAQIGQVPVHASYGVPIFSQWRQASDSLPAVADDPVSCHVPTLKTRIDDTRVYPPILWDTNRWKPLLANPFQDTPWKNKLNRAVWRGRKPQHYHGNETNITLCSTNAICKLMYDVSADPETRVDIMFDDANKINLRRLQLYKIFVLLDYTAELEPWQLYSTSVLIMPPPSRTTWLMEELLEPFIHYIPLNSTCPTYNDVMKLIDWVQNHDQEAETISQRSTLFVYDLLFHPDAERENDWTKKEIVRRYRQYWAD
jgi:hypothetical protein